MLDASYLLDTPGHVMVSKLDKQAFTSEFESHWMSHSFGFVPHQSKMLSKLLLLIRDSLYDTM